MLGVWGLFIGVCALLTMAERTHCEVKGRDGGSQIG